MMIIKKFMVYVIQLMFNITYHKYDDFENAIFYSI